jgi:hypothetical protein
MLTLEQCRRIDPDLANLPDEELLALRDKLYAVANTALDSLGRHEASNPAHAPALLPEGGKVA